MMTLALNDLNLSADLDSQALAAVIGGWKYTGASTSYGSWYNGPFTVYYNRTHSHRGYRHNIKLAYRKRARVQKQTLYYRQDTYIF